MASHLPQIVFCRSFCRATFLQTPVAARLGRAALFDFFRTFAVLAVAGVAALARVLLGRILLVVLLAALRRVLPVGVVYVRCVIC